MSLGTEKADISGIPFTSTPPFTGADDDKWNELSSTSKLWSLRLTTSQPVSFYPDHLFSHEWLAPESFTHSDPSTPYLCFPRAENAHIDYASGQDTRRLSVLLDTPSVVSPCATSESQFPLVDMWSVSDGGSNGFIVSGHILAPNIAPKPQAILHTQPISDLSLDFSPKRYRNHENIGTDFDHPTFDPGNALASSSSFGSTKDVANFDNNETQPLVVIYRAPEKKGSGHRRSRRACAINTEGLWIDKDDLHPGAGHGSSMISVHECRWATSSNPCGMWIIGSRSHVGAHIRKWHTRQRHANNTAKCLWGGCTRAMLKDSINRHVVTVHFGEGFHCRGCDQEFPRKDVYDHHVEDSEACRGADAAMVYGTERRVIDARQVLRRGGAIRYAGR